MAVLPGIFEAGQGDEEVQDYFDRGNTITSLEIGIVVVCGKMEFRIGSRHEGGEELHVKRSTILHEEQGPMD